jgi:hypothetical protein
MLSAGRWLRSPCEDGRVKALAYWALVVVLIAFGILAIFSIGAPFLLMGLMLAILSPWRDRRGVLWTGLAVVFGFVLGYVLVAPLTCSFPPDVIIKGAGMEPVVRCSNLLGIPYRGTGNYNPSLVPAFLAGLGLATAVGITSAWFFRRRPARAAA